MKNRDLVVTLVLILAIIGTFGYLAYQGYSPKIPSTEVMVTSTSTTTPNIPSKPNPVILLVDEDSLVDKFTMSLYEKRKIRDAIINPWTVLEDSRCPSDVQCIQAGRVRVGINITYPYKKINAEMQVGDKISVGSFVLYLKEVSPEKTSTIKIQDDEYQFVFEVLPVVSE